MLLLTFLIIILYAPPSVAEKAEDTAHLTLQKTAISQKKLDTYVVQKGDWIFDIIRQKFGASEKEIIKILEQVKELNPGIKDIHRISPGQELILPKTGIRSTMPAAPESTVRQSAAMEGGDEGGKARPYVVKEGETLSDIIHGELSATDEDIYRMMRVVKRLNPNVKNINKIYPGQKLLLPYVSGGDEEKGGALSSGYGKSFIAESSKVVKKPIPKKTEPIAEKKPEPIKEDTRKPMLLLKEKVAVLRYILSRVNGAVISEGKYFIPLFPAGQITIDCSSVPVVELEDGMTILLDFSGSIPSGLRQVIETTWKNYVIMEVGEEKDIPSLVEAVVTTSKNYGFKTVRDFLTIGKKPTVRVFVDWVVSEKKSKGGKAYSFGIKNVQGMSSILPGNIREYADNEGFEIVELLQGSEVVGLSEIYEGVPMPRLTSDTNVLLAESLVKVLGLEPEKHADVEIYTMGEHGFSLSLKVDLLLTAGNKRVILHGKKIPDHFTQALKERGMEYVYLPEGEKKESAVATVLSALNVHFVADTFRFPFSPAAGHSGGDISFEGIRADADNRSLYFVDQDIDPGINGLLQKKWRVELLTY